MATKETLTAGLGISKPESETDERSNGFDKINIERSMMSFEFWVSKEPKLEVSDHKFDENYDNTIPDSELDAAATTIQKHYISYRTRHRDAAATKIQQFYRTYRSRLRNHAATKIQKVYKSYRTRRNLADCAVLVEEQWWKVSILGSKKRRSMSLNIEQHDTAESRWARARTRADQEGKADKLARQHWLESIDPRHRYGHNLQFYYDVWCECNAKEPFFYWLDIGDGKGINLNNCPRTDLQRPCIRYLEPDISVEWVFLLTGLCLEILSIAFDQASSPRKPVYGLFGMLLAIAAVLICICELIYKGKKERVELRRWGRLWWFYHPNSTKVFGTFPEFYGLIGSISQCICSTVQYVFLIRHCDNPIKVSLWPAIFLICLGAKRLAENRNETHGHSD